MNNSRKHNHEREEGEGHRTIYQDPASSLHRTRPVGRSNKRPAHSSSGRFPTDRQIVEDHRPSIASKRCAIDASRIRQPFNYCCVRPQVASGVPTIERVKESSRSCFLHRPWCHSAWRCSVLGSRPRGYSRMPSAAAVRCFAQYLLIPRTGEPKNFPGGGII